MNEWSGLFLGIIAAATLIMALIQIGAIVAALRIARQAQETLAAVQRCTLQEPRGERPAP